MQLEPPLKPGPTVVGVGASAGGLAALKIMLERVPADSGLAFVVVVHLSPDHESHLAALLQPYVRCPVEQVNRTVPIEKNHVYIIPPNANLNAIDTHLRLSKLEERREERAPIDHFFRTLAKTHDGHAIAVVLTGTGSDGTLGIKDIKANGGVVIVQDPTEAEFDGMPQSAIATGLADFVLTLAEIPETIVRFDRIRPRVPISPDANETTQDEAALLLKISALLRVRTDRDFSRYKRSTILRRVARRMQLNYIEDLGDYVERLRQRPEEIRVLADDLLITVTRFFRDPEVFERLEKVEVPRLFANGGPSDQIRAWSVGCATGEEAYSIAMLLVEEAGRRETSPQIQVFASDLHDRSLQKAREGFYPGDIESDVSPERLKRFFYSENGGFRVRKELRDLVIFAPHNLLADPPFSRMDLISCRNLLIYLEREVQQDVIELFHYALNAEGTLLLGPAEAMDGADLFQVEDKRLCMFRKRNIPAREPRLPVFPLTHSRFADGGSVLRGQRHPAIAYGPLHQQMLEKYAPPSVLVSADDNAVHISEHAGRYMSPAGGEVTTNVVKMLREELRFELQGALQMAREKKQTFDSRPIPVRFNGHSRPVVLHVRPSLEPNEHDFVLVMFEEREPSETETGGDSDQPQGQDPIRIRELEEELSKTRQRLRATIEEYESNKEEMKAANEEMQSTNEELRSTMEEFETSKEELQSVNEELQTVNQQNRHKVEELGQLSSDLQNLLIATDIATLFLDRDLRILRFTPRLGDLFNVRVTDQGRPISDLTHRLAYGGLSKVRIADKASPGSELPPRLGYEELRSDAEAVLDRLVPVERELQDDSGRSYLTRMHPYRGIENRIDGVVVTFIDITDRKEAERMRLELQATEQRAASVKAMREKETELARVSRTLMIGEFATSIAHEINQPLAGVITNAAAGLRWLDGENPNVPEVKNSLDLIIRDGTRASEVIRRIRGFVKGAGEEVEALNIQEIINETIELLRHEIQRSGIALYVEVPDGLPIVRGNRVQMEQVIVNLIINACEAMASLPDGPRELSVRVHQPADGGVLIVIRDSGIGLQSGSAESIFDAFFTTKPMGTGMGLAISRSIIEAHEGRIWAEPNKGAGITVQFILPANGTPVS
jgi:two-component system CheB/CheR fusion protein